MGSHMKANRGTLLARAEQAGIQATYTSTAGKKITASYEGLEALVQAIEVQIPTASLTEPILVFWDGRGVIPLQVAVRSYPKIILRDEEGREFSLQGKLINSRTL